MSADKETLPVNGFTNRLQLKLISEKHLELMFQAADLTMGVKSVLNYHIQVHCEESVETSVQSGKMKKAQKSSTD